MMSSDLALDPSLKVKQWFTGFVEFPVDTNLHRFSDVHNANSILEMVIVMCLELLDIFISPENLRDVALTISSPLGLKIAHCPNLLTFCHFRAL